jgi:hypothetical protein
MGLPFDKKISGSDAFKFRQYFRPRYVLLQHAVWQVVVDYFLLEAQTFSVSCPTTGLNRPMGIR